MNVGRGLWSGFRVWITNLAGTRCHGEASARLTAAYGCAWLRVVESFTSLQRFRAFSRSDRRRLGRPDLSHTAAHYAESDWRKQFRPALRTARAACYITFHNVYYLHLIYVYFWPVLIQVATGAQDWPRRPAQSPPSWMSAQRSTAGAPNPA